LVINTTSTQALPQNKTPFEVWFGRKPRWLGIELDTNNNTNNGVDDDIDDDVDANVDDDVDDDNTDGNSDPVLTEIEARVVANDARLYAQMIKANSG